MRPASKFLEYSLAAISSFIIVILFIVGFYYFNPPTVPQRPSEIVINKNLESGKVLACFSAETRILMGDGLEKNIKDLVPGDKILTRENEDSSTLVTTLVSSVEKHLVNRYVIINGAIKVTMEHSMFINGEWTPVALISHGDKLLGKNGQTIEVKSLQLKYGTLEVYNLKVKTYGTYIAGGVYVQD